MYYITIKILDRLVSIEYNLFDQSVSLSILFYKCAVVGGGPAGYAIVDIIKKGD